LRLSPNKTGIVHLARGAEGFDFLGFQHRTRESGKRRGRWYLQKWRSARARAQVRAKIRERTPRGYAALPPEAVVERLNPALRGWGATFARATPRGRFSAVDCYVNQRLAKLASVKRGLPGWNWTTRFTHGWATGPGVYRLSGTVRHGLLMRGGERCRSAG
jgi:RNA-directed DNA polymerase